MERYVLRMCKKGKSKYVLVCPIYQEDTGNNYQNFADGSFILYVLWCEWFKNETGGMASWCFSNGHNTSLAIVIPEI